MSRSTAVEQVPELAPTPATAITAEDIRIPTIYMGQRSQTQVEAGNAGEGDIYAAASQDDSEADVLWEYNSGQPGVLFIPLFMVKSWSRNPGPGQRLETWPFEARGREYPDGPEFNDPDSKKNAWLTYTYTLVLPEVDAEVPYKTRFAKSSAGAAHKINGDLSRGLRPAYRWTTAEKSRQGVGKWYVAQLATVEPTNDQRAAAIKLFEQLRPGLEQQSNESSAPASPTI